jgi:hypothetical protein
MKERIVRLAELFCAAVLAVTALALAVHVSVADSSPATALFFYATPLPLVAGVALVATLLALVIDKRAVALLLFVVSIGGALFWRQTFPPSRPKGERPAIAAGTTIRLLTWNNGRSTAIAESAAFVRALRPDLAAIIELKGYSDRETGEWQSALGTKRVQGMRGAMLLSSDR